VGDDPSSCRSECPVVRRGRVSWLTHPPAGVARIGVESHAFGALPVSLPEGDQVPYEAAPGELLAIAHAMFLAVALSDELTLAGSRADEIVVEAACTFAGPLSHRELIALDVRASGRVPGLDGAAFREAVDAARSRSLRSAAARADLPGAVEAVLHPSG
jgi:lipoyl-dependent peroxiredoxin